ncbi:hypothetical protein AB0C59_21120 [Streptomyces sp. NPDC048664]|uniref:hypothetical protein n=1 Tax=Streptomyces sp. NPDC048664 TaxID=3154505 RepID=UPI0034315AA5
MQHALANASDAVWQAIRSGAHIYVCGDGRRMAPAVRDALTAIHREQTGSDARAAQAWLAACEADGRYQQDVFA